MQRREILQAFGGFGFFPIIDLPNWFVGTPQEQAQDDAEEQIDDIFDTLRGDEDSLVATRAVAEKLEDMCGELENIDAEVTAAVEAADSPSELPNEARHNLSRLAGIIEILNESFNIEIDTSDLESVDDIFATAANLVPLVLSTKQVVDSACELVAASEGSEDEDAAFEEFLLSCGTLTAEVLMVQYSVGYRASFWTTRNVANRALVHTRGLVGLKVYALLLREVHWTVRENLADAVGAIIDHTIMLSEEFPDAFNEFFDSDDIEELKELADDVEDWRELADSNVLDDDDAWFEDDGDLFESGIDLPI